MKQAVNVDMPGIGFSRPFEFNETDTASDAFLPERTLAELGEAASNAVELRAESVSSVFESQSKKSARLTSKLGEDRGGNSPGAVSGTRETESVVTMRPGQAELRRIFS